MTGRAIRGLKLEKMLAVIEQQPPYLSTKGNRVDPIATTTTFRRISPRDRPQIWHIHWIGKKFRKIVAL